jgi:hypothetical protein
LLDQLDMVATSQQSLVTHKTWDARNVGEVGYLIFQKPWQKAKQSLDFDWDQNQDKREKPMFLLDTRKSTLAY